MARSQRWVEAFELDSARASRGNHRPSLIDLLAGMRFSRSRVIYDIGLFLDEMALAHTDPETGENLGADVIQSLGRDPDRRALKKAADRLVKIWKGQPPFTSDYWSQSAARCSFYAAHMNCRASMLLTAARGLAYACSDNLPTEAKRALLEEAMQRIVAAGWNLPDVKDYYGPTGQRGPPSGGAILKLIASVFQETRQKASSKATSNVER